MFNTEFFKKKLLAEPAPVLGMALGAILIVTIIAIVVARLTGGISQEKAESMVTKLTNGKAHVTKVFPGPKGLQGVVMSGDAGPIIGWITDSGSAIIVGGVVNATTNQNETDLAAAKYLNRTPDASATPAPQAAQIAPVAAPVSQPVAPGQDALTAALNKFLATASIYHGVDQPGLNGDHILYVFFDPNCIFCNKLFNDFQTMQSRFAAAGVRVRYLPVAILKQSSVGRASQIITKGWSALADNEKNFNAATEEGGAPELLTGSTAGDAISAVRENTQQLTAIGAATANGQAGTPTLVWKASNGTPYFLGGYPDPATMDKLFATLK